MARLDMPPRTRSAARALQPLGIVWAELRIIVQLDVEIVLDVLFKAELVVDEVGWNRRRRAH